MKKALLTGIAALFLATGTAAAQTSKVKLPNEILGTWCVGEADGDSLRFVDHNNPSACDPSDYANISNEGYETEPIAMGPRNACKFGDIQLVQHQPVKVYLIQVSCPIGWPNWTMWRGKLELETNHTTVTIKFLPEG